jgi:hypothetical protein
MTRIAAFFAGMALLGVATSSLASNSLAERGEQQLAKMVADRVPGPPVSCIRLHDVRSSQVLDGTAIVYEGSRGRLYVNRPELGAETLRSDDILLTKTWTDELCNIDTVRLLDQGTRFERGFVGLGQFVPYDRPEKKPDRG